MKAAQALEIAKKLEAAEAAGTFAAMHQAQTEIGWQAYEQYKAFLRFTGLWGYQAPVGSPVRDRFNGQLAAMAAR